ncbi:hypothetical protein BJ742DRAFT_864592 [Cladochytrium replicatum]|nr:hypothetical protein BJ742DRAFT_864592 [Cladochytrium replicatum]
MGAGDDFILQVRAGPDESRLSLINVNDEENPLLIQSDRFTGYLCIRMVNFEGTTPENCTNEEPIRNPKSSYFKGRNRRYSIMAQGRFAKDYNGDDLIFAIELDSPLRLPPGFGVAVKIAQWLDPALRCDLQAEQPWMNSPLVCAMNALAICAPDDPLLLDQALPPTASKNGKKSGSPVKSSNLSSPTVSDVAAVAGPWAFHSSMIPEQTSLLFPKSSENEVVVESRENQKKGKSSIPPLTTYEKRKRYFSDVKLRQSVEIKKDYVYCTDFYDAYFDFNTISINLPGFALNARKYFDGQPLRFSAKSKDGEVFFLWFLIAVIVSAACAAQAYTQTPDSNYGNYHAAASHFMETAAFEPEQTAAAHGADDDLFVFFSSADLDRDHHLDGHELRNAFIAGFDEKVRTTLQIVDIEEMVDHALKEDDHDNDGKISWIEYLVSQKYKKK